MTQPAAPPLTVTLHQLLKAMTEKGASDLHITTGAPPLLRIDGNVVPLKLPPLGAVESKQLCYSILSEEQKITFEKTSELDLAFGVKGLSRFRANIYVQRGAVAGAFRTIPFKILSFEEIGLPPIMAELLKKPSGLVLVTGPTGSGKTTTLAAMIDKINSEERLHIITVEDPIEYVHPKKKALVSQREVGTHTQSFASALKGSLREDPDVIVVGELRDTETVRMAVSAAETGHLVIGTMNTPSAAKTIDRLIDLFPPADQPQVRTSLASGLRLIVGQRLVPSVDSSRLHAAAELLPGSVPLSALIREGKTFQIPSLQQRSKALGIIRLDDSLAGLVQARLVSADVARSFAESPAELDALVASRGNAGGASPVRRA